MRKIVIVIMLMSLLSACGTRRYDYKAAEGDGHIPENSKFVVNTAIDKSGYIFQENEEKIDISTYAKNALVAELEKENMYGDKDKNSLTLQTKIIKYEPGNAFGRWLFPGVGSTVVEASTSVSNPDGKSVGEIMTKNSIDAGGGFTIGAWKYVFDHVAVEIVKGLKKAMGKEETAAQ